ncbi:protein WVD2-like 7 [Cucurbita pepo subsp. pepo]|uniref:protein WVD2-like 7 n=1 Tax=Cucurbita pepo subsp. pepo TaxID=3664 RepID=UPI000C9D7200|nr:protein WVD2-like 7 [Cucurbita pepo subsp. pepo]
MADSTCIMQHPFSYTSGFPNESMEGNRPIHGLVQSVSFGRFMSESLDWEKWSTFSHNRYVEEAEKFARPGSVAQKKAFFEAHYKNLAAQRAAAAAAAAAKAAEETDTKQNVDDVEHQEVVAATETAQHFATNDNGNGCGDPSDLKEEKTDSREVEGGGSAITHQVNEGIRQKVENLEQSTTISKKKVAASSSKLPFFSRSSAIPPTTPAHPMAPASSLNNATPKRKSTPKSLRMANFTPIRELNKLTSTVMRKIERSRVGSSSSKPAKDCSTPLRTPDMALKNEYQNHPSATPCSETKRNKLYSPFSFSTFSLRTDERAARRKEKLEEKFNKNESQKKVQLQTKLKEKAETEITKLRQSFCFKARPLPSFYKERKAHKNEEVPKPHPPSPKLGRNSNSQTGEATMAHSCHKPPAKSSRSMNKNVQGKARSTSLQTLMSAHENISPNIQQ